MVGKPRDYIAKLSFRDERISQTTFAFIYAYPEITALICMYELGYNFPL